MFPVFSIFDILGRVNISGYWRPYLMMSDDDNDGQMRSGELKLPDICLTGDEKLRKTSPTKLVPTGDRTRVRCVTGAHATTWPTAVTLSSAKAIQSPGSHPASLK